MKLRTILSEMLSDGVVYHGTNSSFDTFNDNKPIFFTDNPDVAKSYGDVFAGDIVANNYVVFNTNQIKIVK